MSDVRPTVVQACYLLMFLPLPSCKDACCSSGGRLTSLAATISLITRLKQLLSLKLRVRLFFGTSLYVGAVAFAVEFQGSPLLGMDMTRVKKIICSVYDLKV